MTLTEALAIVAQPPPADADALEVALLCGSTPLHLATLLTAELRLRHAGRPVRLETGLFDDLFGSLRLAAPQRLDAIVVVVEWPDLDPRLGLRRLGGWSASAVGDVVSRVTAQLAALAGLIAQCAGQTPVVVSLPTLPLPPVFHHAAWQAGTAELALRRQLLACAETLAAQPQVRVVSTQRLDELSPPGGRLHVASAVAAGFPYRLPHAAVLASLLADAATNRSPLKGLITDLDNTLWRGVVGDDGVEGVAWDLEGHAQLHGLYQQLLAALAGEGVLLAIVSKNDPRVVDEVFARRDLPVRRDVFCPVDVSWGSKAQAVSRVLARWNIHADSVVFVDDSEAELAEVRAAHPRIEGVRFPAQPDEAYRMLCDLRNRFGRAELLPEDTLRAATIRSRGEADHSPETAAAGFGDDWLASADAEITIDFRRGLHTSRAIELINKTNQFNLNGRRLAPREWAALEAAADGFVATVAYRDRFGPLGRVAVLGGRLLADGTAQLTTWVLSCRAFGRRVEHQCLDVLFGRLGRTAVAFDYRATERNAPLTACLTALLGVAPVAGVALSAAAFRSACPPLCHRIRIEDDEPDERQAPAPDEVFYRGVS